MSRSLTRKDFLIFTAASAGGAFVAAACSSDNTSGGGAGAGPGPGGSPGSGGSSAGSAGASAGSPSSGGSSAGAPAAGAPAGGSSGTPGSGGALGGGGSGGTAGGAGAGTAGGAGKGGAGGAVSGGAGGMSGAGGGGGTSCTADVVAKISCPHDPPHTLTIAKADIDAAVANKVFTLSMALGHTHMITMTAADWTLLKSGGTVFKYVDAGSNQDHCVVLSCGTVNAATAAGAMCGSTATGTDNAVSCTTPWP